MALAVRRLRAGDFRQGLEDALAGTVDGEAYQKVTRGINLLERYGRYPMITGIDQSLSRVPFSRGG